MSYAKLFKEWTTGTEFIEERTNLPVEEFRGVAVSGVRQTLRDLKEKEGRISKHMNKSQRDIFIYAFTDPTNSVSEAVLLRNGFEKLLQQYDYDGKMNNLWIKKL